MTTISAKTILRSRNAVAPDKVLPIHWGANQKGMQADQECDAPVELFDPVHNVGHYWATRQYRHML